MLISSNFSIFVPTNRGLVILFGYYSNTLLLTKLSTSQLKYFVRNSTNYCNFLYIMLVNRSTMHSIENI